MIKCELIQLISRQQMKEGRKISYRDIAQATGLPPSTLSRLARNKVSRFDADTMSTLCAYFGCTLGELLVYKSE